MAPQHRLLLLLRLFVILVLLGSASAGYQEDVPQEFQVAGQGLLRNQALGEGSVLRRTTMEVEDYPGSGANDRHDPRNPGRS
ncbi:unnamed protein product [Spirodela intermedia]|uniref:Uncharacterized protein n=1 Tax=Spirodela intermedia TaxID=51605 RepID=A0A7I8L3D3_SPIIN|nr:unnamed protein product [Spirodela intermedia]